MPRSLDQLLRPGARPTEHEYLLSIPMEPQGYPLNDPGASALLTGAAAGSRTGSGWTGR